MRLDWLGRPRDARDAAALCVAGVAQPHIHRTHTHFAWQAWHNRRFAWQASHSWHWVARLDWLGRPRDVRDAAALCVAGVAQPHIHHRVAWQAWHNLTSTVVLRGRRGTHGTEWRAWTAWQAWHNLTSTVTSHPPWFCVAGMAQPHIHRRFAWQASKHANN